MLECIGYFAPDAQFETYRVIASNGRAKRGNLVAAIADASNGDQELVNLSLGIHHSDHNHGDCGGKCRIAEETRLAIDSGTTVIAAAGNRKQEDALATHCPALLEDVVGIGGFVSRCTAKLVKTDESGQYWVYQPDGLHGPFCGQHGCSQTSRCTANRYEQPWQGNVLFHNAAPEVLAPIHHPAGTKEDPILQSGTSFGTGVVTGILAALLGDLSTTDVQPTPAELHRAVRNGSASIDRGQIGKFDAEGTWDELTD